MKIFNNSASRNKVTQQFVNDDKNRKYPRKIRKGRLTMNLNQWLLCPLCGSKTRVKIQENTVLENFPLFCPKCKQETIIHVRQLKTLVIQEPDAKTQSR